MIDIGVNLTHRSFEADLPQVIERAENAGVQAMILTGISTKASQNALQLAQSFPHLYATAGIHPHHASEFDETSVQSLTELLSNEKVVAVGECGLDFNRNFSPREKQIECFQEQLKLAATIQKPLFLHERDAFETQYNMLKTWRDHISAGVVHCFTGDQEKLDKYLDLDLHIGITGWICDERRGKELYNIVSRIPENRLMIETDAPFLMPRNIPGQGKNRRNEPANLEYVLKTLAEARNSSPEALAAQTTANTIAFFQLKNH